jgi:hypothetical protein
MKCIGTIRIAGFYLRDFDGDGLSFEMIEFEGHQQHLREP